MKNEEVFKELEFLFEKIMHCDTLDDLKYLKEYIAERKIHITKNKNFSDADSGSDMTTRIETGPALIGWGKGKDE